MTAEGGEARVVGTYDVPDEQFTKLPHHEGFDLAVQNALDQIQGEDGEELRAQFKLEATIRVYTDAGGVDPGGVGQYRVIVTY